MKRKKHKCYLMDGDKAYNLGRNEERKRILKILRNLRVQYTLYEDEEIIGLLDDLKQEIEKTEGMK